MSRNREDDVSPGRLANHHHQALVLFLCIIGTTLAHSLLSALFGLLVDPKLNGTLVLPPSPSPLTLGGPFPAGFTRGPRYTKHTHTHITHAHTYPTHAHTYSTHAHTYHTHAHTYHTYAPTYHTCIHISRTWTLISHTHKLDTQAHMHIAYTCTFKSLHNAQCT